MSLQSNKNVLSAKKVIVMPNILYIFLFDCLVGGWHLVENHFIPHHKHEGK